VIHLVIIGVVKEVMFVFGPLLSLFKNSTKLIDIILKLSAVFHINSHIKQNFFVVDFLAFLT
jgi:presenilin-like A22 family membrane protease